MKTLVLMRHGKISMEPALTKQNPFGKDIDNGLILKDEGIVEIFDIGLKLKDKTKLDAIYYSGALRTKETASIIRKCTKTKGFKKAEWLNENTDILEEVKNLNNKDNNICLVTHVKNIEDFVSSICSCEERDKYMQLTQKDGALTMRQAIIFRFDTDDWNDIENHLMCCYERVIGEKTPQRQMDAQKALKNINIFDLVEEQDSKAFYKKTGIGNHLFACVYAPKV